MLKKADEAKDEGDSFFAKTSAGLVKSIDPTHKTLMFGDKPTIWGKSLRTVALSSDININRSLKIVFVKNEELKVTQILTKLN